MGITNYGNQNIYTLYGQDATASNVNKRLSKIIQEGIYEGGTLYIDSGNDILIGVFVVFIRGASGQAVKIETTTNISLTLSEATPYIIGRYSWNNSATNYMDVYAVAEGSIANNDIVFGKGVYVGGVLTSFDYSDKTWGLSTTDGDVHVMNDIDIKRHAIVSESIVANSVYIRGDDSGNLIGDYSGALTLTNVTTEPSGTARGQVQLEGEVDKNSTGMLKIYINGTVAYIPYWTDIGE